ncbi:hypothetical protein [Hyphomonas sp.]|uniref:hypothetical protein n=1 Tax=Hyphomonas sp. TaxID=87 RepID=UPI003F6EDE79
MNKPSSPLQMALGLRLATLLAFPFGVVLVALMQRSPLMIVLLAAAMVGVSLVERMRLARLTGSSAPMSLAAILPGFAVRLGGLAGLFIVLLGVLALFRDTSLARGLGLADAAILFGVTGFVLAANAISARIATTEVGTVMSTMNASFRQASPGGNDMGGEIIEGEFHDPEAGPR